MDDGLIYTATKQVEATWNRSRPKMVAELKRQGTLHEVVKQAAIDWMETRDHLMSQGMPPKEADNAARREWVVIPDLGELEEYGPAISS